MLRQHGCPTVFLTLSAAEFDWKELLKSIVETVLREKVNDEFIDNLTTKEKNRLVNENVVQTTIYFQRRIDKIFKMMGLDFFDGCKETYHVSSYFFRIEFQQRGILN